MLLVREWRGVTRGLLPASAMLPARECRPGVSGAPARISIPLIHPRLTLNVSGSLDGDIKCL